MRNVIVSVSVLILLTFLSLTGPAGHKQDPIRLLPEKTLIIPAEFYFKNIIDARSDKDATASLVFTNAEKQPSTHLVDLYGGGYQAIRNFMLQSMVQNQSKRPVVVLIKECKILETVADDGRINGRIAVVFQFDLEKKEGNTPLTQYNTVAKYSREISNLSVVEPTLRQLLANSLKFINNWMNNEAPRNVALARAVKISFSDYVEQDADTVYYEGSRPLNWGDFQAVPRSSRYIAEIFPSFGYHQHSKIIDGVIYVDLAIKVYVVKSASWITPGRQSAYSLNHEQRHFDLVKLISEQFKRKLKSETLTPDNYEGIINFEYIEFFRAMNKKQEQYDSETSHGTNYIAQAQWNSRIEQELSALK